MQHEPNKANFTLILLNSNSLQQDGSEMALVELKSETKEEAEKYDENDIYEPKKFFFSFSKMIPSIPNKIKKNQIFVQTKRQAIKDRIVKRAAIRKAELESPELKTERLSKK